MAGFKLIESYNIRLLGSLFGSVLFRRSIAQTIHCQEDKQNTLSELDIFVVAVS